MLRVLLLVFASAVFPVITRAETTKIWTADRGDGTYANPVLNADYSDPDVLRVGDDFYLTASSFNHVPGLPILHSRDLVNWSLINHALPRLNLAPGHTAPDHGNGVWAPSLRFHDGRYWIFWGDPDQGIFQVNTTDPSGVWSAPHLVVPGKGLIDPCPLWDDDGRVWLVHGWAKSRAGFNNRLTLRQLTADASSTVPDDPAPVIIDGDALPRYRTLEGPKFYRRDGWYWIFAPAGGVTEGWQSAFRSRDIHGPYEARIILEQGDTAINGPHQGGWVDTPRGEFWFLHFQDRGPQGRVVHLQPMSWAADGWPVLGDGHAHPVLTHAKPDLPPAPPAAPPVGDSFTTRILGLQWQWQGNPSADWLELRGDGIARLRALPLANGARSLWNAPALLLQKPFADTFIAETSLALPESVTVGTTAGLLVFGQDYAWLGLVRTADGTQLIRAEVHDALKRTAETRTVIASWPAGQPVHLRLGWNEAGRACTFAYEDPATHRYLEAGPAFAAREGRWVGAKFGLFAQGTAAARPDDQALFTALIIQP
jgi:beta-xylosidase